MLLVLIAWLYVAVLMAAAEATHPQGSLLGALVTLLLYGIGPIAIVMYVMGTPLRLRARKATEAAEHAASLVADQPDARGQPPGEPIAPKREEA